MDEILQLKITLKWSKPPIWRMILVKSRTTFEELHNIIQIVMGWENYHMYDFHIYDIIIQKIEDEEDKVDFGLGFLRKKNIFDSKTTKLDFLLPYKKFEYTYDFGDNWIHDIKIEKILPINNNIFYPVCIGGKLSYPPEDCGGLGGYYDILNILKDKKHPEYAQFRE